MTTTCVAAVVVTHNRRDLLTECLDALGRQSRPVDRTIVVDNASTDGTAEALAARSDVEVVSLSRNIGGAGGFAAGLATALAADAEAVWLLDDDTIPEPSALDEVIQARDTYPGPTPSVVASRVVWTDGRDHPMNTPRTRPGASAADMDAAASVGARPIRSASFVSVLVDSDAVRRHGLPIADYFLWNDDFEFTTRLLRDGVGLYRPSSVVVHKTRTYGSSDADPGERFYYEVRNKVWTFTRSPALTPAERLLYGGSTLHRWGRTVIRSHHRGVLWDGLRRGLREARSAPRPTSDVLATAGFGGEVTLPRVRT